MIVDQARALAREWVINETPHLPGFLGAFFHGSINWLPDDATLPATSDLDVVVVLDGTTPLPERTKFLYRRVMIDVSYLPWGQIATPEQVLGLSHLAGSLKAPGIILDPSGKLVNLQASVSAGYARRAWVYRRCDYVIGKISQHLRAQNESDPFHDQVTNWLFETGLTTHVLLVAGLKNPTVRKRYLAVRDLLADYGRSDFYGELLDLLGCTWMSQQIVESHLSRLAEAYDMASAVIKTPFVFAADISKIARPNVIDGSQELISRGSHREAIFWMVATYARCMKVFFSDAPVELREAHATGFHLLMKDLGITSYFDLQRRSHQVEAFLPRLWQVAESIIASNPEIEN